MVQDVIDIDPDINYIPVHRRLPIAYVACQSIEVSIDDGSPRVKKGASMFSILWFAYDAPALALMVILQCLAAAVLPGRRPLRTLIRATVVGVRA